MWNIENLEASFNVIKVVTCYLLKWKAFRTLSLSSKYSCLVRKLSFPKSITVAVIKQRARELEATSIEAGEDDLG